MEVSEPDYIFDGILPHYEQYRAFINQCVHSRESNATYSVPGASNALALICKVNSYYYYFFLNHNKIPYLT